MPDAIDDREHHDDPVFAEEKIREERSEDRSQINERDKVVEMFCRFCIRKFRDGGIPHQPKVVHHENGEDGSHSVEAEPFRGLISDDVGNTRRHLAR